MKAGDLQPRSRAAEANAGLDAGDPGGGAPSIDDSDERALANADAAYCRTWIARHSKSFYLSSLLLPGPVRRASWALYAFCRLADDTVDEAGGPVGDGGGAAAAEPLAAVAALRDRLERVYGAGAAVGALQRSAPGSQGQAIDRAYARLAAGCAIPRGVPEALLAGMEMDARGEGYPSWDSLLRYCFRVASTVGLMMTRVMSPDRALRPDAVLRAAELGVAMQLTNIARDVGEDARRGRVYLPDELLAACGIDRQAVLQAGSASAAIRQATRLTLLRADDFYRSAERGIALLPWRCRLAIASARYIYAAIGADLARSGYDSITRRAHTSLARKLLLVVRALPWTVATPAPTGAGPADALLLELIAAAGLGAEAS